MSAPPQLSEPRIFFEDSGFRFGVVAIKDSELRKMSAPQQDAAMRGLVRVAKGKPNGELKDLEVRIAEFEKKYELSSDQLPRELAQGQREELGNLPVAHASRATRSDWRLRVTVPLTTRFR